MNILELETNNNINHSINDEQYEYHNDQQDSIINVLRCIICFENHNNLPNKLLNKICICEDSNICFECLEDLKINKIIKCPVCRRKLDINKSYYLLSNIVIFLKYNKLLCGYIFNIIITNIVIYKLYYSNHHFIPDKLYKDIDILNFKNTYHIRKIILLNKKSLFLITNMIQLVYYPIITQIFHYLLYINNTRQIVELINIILLCVIIINTILLTILIIYQSIDVLLLYMELNIVLYFIYSITILGSYLYNYLEKKYIYIKNNHMKFNIKYNILSKYYSILPQSNIDNYNDIIINTNDIIINTNDIDNNTNNNNLYINIMSNV
jgi:hypothetical protein